MDESTVGYHYWNTIISLLFVIMFSFHVNTQHHVWKVCLLRTSVVKLTIQSHEEEKLPFYRKVGTFFHC